MTKTQINHIITQPQTAIYDRYHMEYAGEVTIHDFNTAYPNPHRYYAYTPTELENKKNLPLA